MLRLTPPTKATFATSILAIAAGVLLYLDVVDIDVDNVADVAFWLTAGGGLLLVVGVLFRRI